MLWLPVLLYIYTKARLDKIIHAVAVLGGSAAWHWFLVCAQGPVGPRMPVCLWCLCELRPTQLASAP